MTQKNVLAIATALAAVGALNWGLVGAFDWDAVAAIFGNATSHDASAASRAVYLLVGVAGTITLAAAAGALGSSRRYFDNR